MYDVHVRTTYVVYGLYYVYSLTNVQSKFV